jgi:hypothetical protein
MGPLGPIACFFTESKCSTEIKIHASYIPHVHTLPFLHISLSPSFFFSCEGPLRHRGRGSHRSSQQARAKGARDLAANMASTAGRLAARLAAIRGGGAAPGPAQGSSVPVSSEPGGACAQGTLAQRMRAREEGESRADASASREESGVHEARPLVETGEGRVQSMQPSPRVSFDLGPQGSAPRAPSTSGSRFSGVAGSSARDSPAVSGSAVISLHEVSAGIPASTSEAASNPEGGALGVQGVAPPKQGGVPSAQMQSGKEYINFLISQLPKEVGDASEENARTVERAGLNLLLCIYDELDLIGIGKSRFVAPPFEKRVQSMMNVLVNSGGAVGSACNRARLFLRDFGEYLATACSVPAGTSLFPIETEDVRLFVEWLHEKDPPVIEAVERVRLAPKFLAAVGCISSTPRIGRLERRSGAILTWS